MADYDEFRGNRGGSSGAPSTASTPAPTITAPTIGPPSSLSPGQFMDPNVTPGMIGKARFDKLMESAPMGDGYINWVLAQPEDPTDIEFTRMLRAAKEAARQQQEGITNPADQSLMWARAGKGGTKDEKDRRDAAPPSEGRPIGENVGLTVGDNRQNQRAEGEIRNKSDKSMERYYGTVPIIRGVPASTEQILSEEADDQPNSPWLQQFAKSQAIQLKRQTGSSGEPLPGAPEELAKNGDYVYVGTEKDKYGYERPVYVYAIDAKASMAKMPPDKIRAYQKALKLPVTGIAEGPLKQLWDNAVAYAQEYARAGQKVELQFIFDTLVQSAIKQVNARGGGGGGGAGAPDLNEDDYYFAMMQVLGDISGVKDNSGA